MKLNTSTLAFLNMFCIPYKMAICEPRREASEEPNSDDTLILDFQALEL